MGIGTSIFLIAVGAILYFAVNADISGLEISTVGLILMIVGILGLVDLALPDVVGLAPRQVATDRPVAPRARRLLALGVAPAPRAAGRPRARPARAARPGGRGPGATR